MESTFFYSLGLFLHMVGLFFIAGGALGAIVAERLLWQQVHRHKLSLATALLPLLRQFPVVIQAGSLLMLLSGLLMLQQVEWSYWGQFWLMGKLVLYVLLLLNGLLVAKPLGGQVAKTLMQQSATVEMAGSKDDLNSIADGLPRLRRRMYLFTATQIGMLLLLFVLSTFKPV